MAGIRKYFGIFIFLGLALGFFFPSPVLPLKPFLIYLLGIMMFLSCLKIGARDILLVEREWWKYLVLMIIVFAIPPLVVFAFKGFVSQITFVGLMIIAAAPSAIAVVFLADILGGEPHKALVGTTLAQLLSPLATPFLVWAFAHTSVSVDTMAMFVLIAKLVIGPFVLAQVMRYYGWDKKILKFAGWTNEFLLFLLIWATIAPASAVIRGNLSEFSVALGIAAILLLIQAAAGFFFGKAKREKITWITIAISKNFTVSSVLALTLFGAASLVGPAAFVFLSNAVLVPLEWWFLRKRTR